MAGYAGKPLPKKLGIKVGHKVCLLDAPRRIVRTLTPANDEIRIVETLREPLIDVAMLFVDRVAELERRFSEVTARMHPAGCLWIAFPKKKRGSDVTEELVRRIALAAGMVDNKVCSMGEFSGMRLVLRGQNRDAMLYRAEPPPISRRVRRPTQPGRVVRSGGSTQLRARASRSK
ncbi:MAG: hypothetical protein QM831_34700 [Kofleriaceae bacterium]